MREEASQRLRLPIGILLILNLLFIPSAQAFSTTVTVIDPTKRTFTFDPNGNLAEELVVGTGVTTRFTYDGEGKRA